MVNCRPTWIFTLLTILVLFMGCKGPTREERQFRLWSKWISSLEEAANEALDMSGRRLANIKYLYHQLDSGDERRSAYSVAENLLDETLTRESQLSSDFEVLIKSTGGYTDNGDLPGIRKKLRIDSVNTDLATAGGHLISQLIEIQSQRLELWSLTLNNLRELEYEMDDGLSHETLFFIHQATENDRRWRERKDAVWQYYFAVEAVGWEPYSVTINGRELGHNQGRIHLPTQIWSSIRKNINTLSLIREDTTIVIKFRMAESNGSDSR